MHCTTPMAKLAHSATIPCVMSQMGPSSTSSDINKVVDKNGRRPAGGSLTDPLSPFNRSQSFDARRQVWSRVEAHWARMTTDDRLSVIAPSIGFYSVVKYDPQQDQVPPLYQRLKSWLSSGSSTAPPQQQQQNYPVPATKVPSAANSFLMHASFTIIYSFVHSHFSFFFLNFVFTD